MKHRPLWEVTLSTTDEAEDAVGELFRRVLGEPSMSYRNLDTKVLRVSAYVDFDPRQKTNMQGQLNAGLKTIRRSGLKVGSGRMSFRRVRRENWTESWRKHFRAFEVGNCLLVKPDWSKRRARRGQAVVTVNPGLSFGTGQHPTTAFCLDQLAASRVAGVEQSFLDIGTGSGILAIAAAKLGYGPVEAFDNDLDSVHAARVNARANDVTDEVRVFAGDVGKMPLGGRRYSVVCANLMATLLLEKCRRIVARVAGGGLLVLAGLLRSEFGRVREAYEGTGVRLVAARSQGEWRSGAFRRA